MTSVSIWEIWRHSPGEMVLLLAVVVVGCQDRWEGSHLLSRNVVLVAAVSVIGCDTMLEPANENKKRKIDSLTDDR